MYLASILLATAVTGTLHVVTERHELLLGNRARAREAVRYLGLTLVWGIVLSAAIHVLIPSAWS